MGIQGLLPYLKKASRQASIKEFKGCTVAIDSYCWLHRGAFACAEKLALGEKTDQYVFYCMKYINNLLSFGIRPIMVFDGCRLPSKKEVERTRRERRDMNRKKAAQLLREGKRSEARDCLAQCIDITPHMALELMNACREKSVDCIVAPYEADAQLAYLNKIGLAQVIITEDSDLLLFGCDKIMFKMDIAGNGILIEKNDLNSALQLPPDIFTFDKFRYICILSGCDYLSNLPGIGLAKASKLFRLSRQNDMSQVIRKIPSVLRMSNLVVPEDYVDRFFRADNTFLYQLVFDPLKRKLLPLNPYPDDLDPKDLDYAGPYMSDEAALQIALGNANVNTGERIADFDPDVFRAKTNSWSQNAAETKAMSIWNTSLDPCAFRSTRTAPEVKAMDRPSTKGMEVIIKGPVLKDRANTAALKRARQVAEEEEEVELTDQDLVKLYSELDESLESSMSCSNNNTSFSADNQSSPSKKRSRLSGLELAADEANLNSDQLTRSSREMMTSNVLNITADPTERSLGDVFERRRNQVHLSPVKGCLLGKENSPEPHEEMVQCHNQDQPKRRNAFAFDGKATKETQISLSSTDLELSANVEGDDILSQPSAQDKRRKVFAADGKESKEMTIFLNSSNHNTTVRESPEAKIIKASSSLQLKSKPRNLFALNEDMPKEPGFSLNASKHDTAEESKGKDVFSPEQVQMKRRNVFAVDGKAPRESRFSLNSSKVDTTAVNVKSRFFTMSSPSRETKFFQQLKREHGGSNNRSSSPQDNLASQSDEEQGNVEEEEEEEEEEVIKVKSEKKPSEVIPSTGDCSSSSEIRSTESHGNFKFSQLSMFKSQFDGRKMTKPLTNAKTNLPFKSVAVASGVSEFRTSVSSRCSKIDPSNEDFDCLSEDPLDMSNIVSAKEDRSATEKPSNESFSSETKFSSCHRLSLSYERTWSNEKEVPNGVRDGLLVHKQRSSLDSRTREMSESPTGRSSILSESPTGKSSTGTKGFLSKGCRTSGLLKTKTNGCKTLAADGCKQSAISQYFHTSFALNKKSVAKIAPCVKSPV